MKNKNKTVKIIDEKVDTKQFLLTETQQNANNNTNGNAQNGGGIQNGAGKQNGAGQNGVTTKPPLPKDDRTEKLLAADKKNKENSDKKLLKKGNIFILS